jgi:hypothetical protein
MTLRDYAKYGGIAAIAFAVFVALAQAQVLNVPYFTPATISIDGLDDAYAEGEKASFVVTAKGYGSNCHMLQAELLHEGERKSFYRKADDCRFMDITHGQYNFTRPFEYDSQLLAKGSYRLDVLFEDLVDGKKASTTRTFNVGD